MLFIGQFRAVAMTAVGQQRLFTSTVRHLSIETTISGGQRSIVRQVYPYSNIKITSNYHLNIKPYDILDCPDGNLLRITLQPKPHAMDSTPTKQINEFIANFDATIQIDDHNIVIDTIDDLSSQVNADELANAVEVLFEVPVKSNLKVCSRRDVNIESMYGDEINVIAYDGDVQTKNIHTVALNLIAQNGNIRCLGNTLAHKVECRSHGQKNIHFNQILGDSLTAITENGIISTNSCYAENSKFITQTGGLHLKNVHKKSEMYLLDAGDLDVTGFHGILNVTSTNGGTLNFQLTEVYGESYIEAQNPNKFNVNISEFVEKHTCLSIVAKTIVLNSTLQHFDKCYRNGSGDSGASGETEMQVGNRDTCDDLLTIRTNGNLTLGKLSWMDTVKMKLAAQKTNTK